jgi:hypothetical protein
MRRRAPARGLTTLLFTDIVGSSKHSVHSGRRPRFRLEFLRQRFSSQPGFDHAHVQIEPPPEPRVAEPRHEACDRVRHQFGERSVGRSNRGLLFTCDQQRGALSFELRPGRRSGEALLVRAPEGSGRSRAELDAELVKPDQAQEGGHRPGIHDRRDRRRAQADEPVPPSPPQGKDSGAVDDRSVDAVGVALEHGEHDGAAVREAHDMCSSGRHTRLD